MYRLGGTRQTNGATANRGVGGFASTATASAVPVAAVSDNVLLPNYGLMHNFSRQAHSLGTASGFASAARFASPMVNIDESLGGFYSSPMRSHVSQVRSSRRQQTAFQTPIPASAYAVPDYSFAGGQNLGQPFVQPTAASVPHNYSNGTSQSHQLGHSSITASQIGTLRSVVPAPTLSLQIRLQEISPELLAAREAKANMKSVERVTKTFTLTYSGDSSQDWINHVNELERRQTVRHLWLPRQFYFGLQETLTGKAKETMALLEKGLERPKLRDFIPTWYSPSQQEWHVLNQDQVPPFAHFPFRTRVVVVIYYFLHKFQANTTSHEVWDRFTHAMQSMHESL